MTYKMNMKMMFWMKIILRKKIKSLTIRIQ